MRKYLIFCLVLMFPVNCLAHSVRYQRKLSDITLGMTKAQVKKIMLAPDAAIGTMRGLEIWKYDINRYRDGGEKGEIFLIFVLTASLGAIWCLFSPERSTYCFYFTNDGSLVQWGERDDWEQLKYAEEVY
jgi:hypothetical protein